MSRAKNRAAALLKEIARRKNTPAEIERNERERVAAEQHRERMRELYEAPIRADERRKVATEIAAELERRSGISWPSFAVAAKIAREAGTR